MLCNYAIDPRMAAKVTSTRTVPAVPSLLQGPWRKSATASTTQILEMLHMHFIDVQAWLSAGMTEMQVDNTFTCSVRDRLSSGPRIATRLAMVAGSVSRMSLEQQ